MSSMKGQTLIWRLTTLLLTTVFPATAQQPKKILLIGYLRGSTQLVSPPVPRQFGSVCVSLAT